MRIEQVIQFQNIFKQYRGRTVLNDICFSVKKGSIYGVIGPNGAGKTTLFKILSGLIKPSGGTLQLFEDEKNLAHARTKMSFMIEMPYLEPEMTAHQNLEVLRILYGVADKGRILEVLHMVGLDDINKKKVKNFSLGMKQRLGIAMALLKNPQVLVLDEPMNGLDPEGIVEIRNFLLKLNQESGMTIIISSHLLTELYQLADEFVIIREGVVVEQVGKAELAKQGDNLEAYYMKKVGKANAQSA